MAATIEDLEATERRLQAAIVGSDVEALDALLDDGVVYIGPDGAVADKAADLAAHRSGDLDVQRFEVVSLKSRVIGGVGLTFVAADLGGVAAGQPFSASLRYTRTWIHTGAGWRVVAAVGSPLTGQP